MCKWLLLSDVIRNGFGRFITILNNSSELLVMTDTGEQVSNLVGIHAWCWNLDRASPIEIVMAQGERELLKLNLCEA